MNVETLDKFFDLPDGKHLIIESRMVLKLQRLLKFSPLCRDNLQGRIFLKGIRHCLLVFFLLMLILFVFLPMMYS